MKRTCTRSVVSAAVLVVSGCASGSSDEAATAEFLVFPEKIYVGADDAGHTYTAPVITQNAPGAVTWKLDDESVASLTPDGSNARLVGKKAGATMLHITAGNATLDASVTVYGYTGAQYAAGEKRYTTGFDDMNPACKDCHAPGKGPDHTSTELDADTDEEIQHTFVTGKDPEGRPVNYEHEYDTLLKNYSHEWHVTEQEKIGLVAYLRALPDMGYPAYDEPTTEK